MSRVSGFRLALIQLAVGKNKADNLLRATDLIQKSVNSGRADLVVLPECFNSPYGTGYFADYAEQIDGGETCLSLSSAARECCVHLIGGSIPERRGSSLFNTTTAWGPDGKLLATYSKAHLFDIDIPGKIRFQESDILSAGDKLSTFVTPFCRVGLGICYDVRFADMAAVYAKSGCDLLVYPGAFNMTTGPLHWQLLCQARSLDNQLFTAMVSPARDDSASYVAWGHSMVTSPWGEVIASTGHEEDIVYADIDLSECERVRRSIPLRHQKRPDLYSQPVQM